jgi:predicted ATP-dependent endonuclease of OLD family
MNYSKFTVSNFRCFAEEKELKLAQPVLHRPGSGITYIVGANNSGKTTLIESMWIKKDHYLNDSEKQSAPPIFKFYRDSQAVRTVKLLRDNACVFTEEPQTRGDDDLFEVISSRRHWESVANGVSNSRDIIKQSEVGENPRKQQGNVQTALFLKDIETQPQKYEEFTRLVQRVIPEFTDWAVGFENQPYIKYLSSDGISHKADFLGDGVISVIRILAHLYEERVSGLIIDEPELSLHPLAQKRLIKLIAECAEKRQIIISTHSPYFVSWEYLKNGATLNRIAKAGDTKSEIFTIKNYSQYEKLIKGGNWQQPFLMDVVSKELFFQDDILFVEGQEDAGLLKSFFSNTEINLFGYGVRGYHNFEFALELAKDLGIKKACVLIDSASDSTSHNNENAIKAKLMEQYGDYRIVQWNKADIRDKKAITLSAKEGYFDINGQLKPADQQDFNEKIQSVIDYFTN